MTIALDAWCQNIFDQWIRMLLPDVPLRTTRVS